MRLKLLSIPAASTLLVNVAFAAPPEIIELAKVNVALFFARHSRLSGKLCADHEILTFFNSQITDQILTVATSFDLPVLGVHDSFIVAREEQETLLQIIGTATREIVGAELSVEVTSQALNPVRSEGYLARLEHHQSQSS